MSSVTAIVDRGRGPQLSTSRITVQDLVPYFQFRYTYDQMIDLMPVLTVEEIQVVEQYIREHFDQVMEQDRRIRERSAQRKTPPEIEDVLRRGGEQMDALRAEFTNKQLQERNGAHSAR
jgi:hypothetical protein